MSITALVMRKLKETFADVGARTAAVATLEAYVAKSKRNEPERILLAILKLSEGDLSRLSQAAESALIDYRDVLAWAEYPREMLLDGHEEPAVLDAARARDRDQYLRWLGDD